MALRGPGRWLWRWRRNPLKRTSDVLESWLLLTSWALTLLIAVSTAVAVGRAVDHQLDRERAEHRRVEAHLTARAPGTAPPGGWDPRAEYVWATVRWTAGGSAHTGQVRVRAGSGAGTPVAVWTDRHGRQVSPPATEFQTTLRAAVTGTLAGLLAALLPFSAGRILRGRLLERRLEEWDAQWARLGPQWRRSTS